MPTHVYFVDIDGTICTESVASVIGRYAINERKRLAKASAALQALRVVADISIFGERRGLKTFVDALAKAGVTKEEVERHAEKAFNEYSVPGAIDLLKDLSESEDNELHMLTTGTEIGPNVLRDKYEIRMKESLCNTLTYDNNKVSGCNVWLTEKNIGDVVENFMKEHDYDPKTTLIIDNRPKRYSNRLRVYDSTKSFKFSKK